jgi:hypothetical protein
MTRAEMKTLIWGWLDDPNGTYFTSTLLNTWINLAQREVQKKLLNAGQNFYMKPVTTLTVANQADYVLPTDFFVENRLELVLSGTGVNENIQPIKPITTNQKDLYPTGIGTPSVYSIKKDRVTLFPIPSQQWTLRLFYSPSVTDMASDADTPDIPAQFQEMVPIVAAFNGFIKDDRAPSNLLVKAKEYDTLLKTMAQERTQDQSRQVVDQGLYGNWGEF